MLSGLGFGRTGGYAGARGWELRRDSAEARGGRRREEEEGGGRGRVPPRGQSRLECLVTCV